MSFCRKTATNVGQFFNHEKTWMFIISMNSIHFTCCSGIFLIVVISLVGLRSAEMPVGKKVHILWQGQKIWRHLPLSFDIKVHIFWEGHKILQNLHCRFALWSASNLRWRFRKLLWPSQNIWTLKKYLEEGRSKVLSK